MSYSFMSGIKWPLFRLFMSRKGPVADNGMLDFLEDFLFGVRLH